MVARKKHAGGRPLASDGRSVQIFLRISPTTKARIEKLAREDYRTMAHTMAMLIDEALDARTPRRMASAAD